jgi:2,4-dichlorophenol 6-monooxygenase
MRIEDTLMAQAAPWDLMANTSFCTSLVGEELGRVLSWGTDPHRRADYVSASPCQMVDAPQTVVEPILIGEAQKRGARIRFDTEYISHVDNGDKVVTTVKDRLNGHVYEIKSSYLIGADGAKSQVAKDLDLPFEGPGAVAGALAIVVEIDLTQYVDFRPSVLWWMLQPGADKQGVGLGVLRMIKPWTEWMLMWGYNPADGPPKLDDAFTRTLAENLIGRKDFEMKIKSSSPWTVNHHFASKIAKGRVFCAGDAIHRHPPTNGLGSNTSIQVIWTTSGEKGDQN